MNILAIDPGKNIGLAWLDQEGRLLSQEILDLADLKIYPLKKESLIVLGNGTGVHLVKTILEERLLSYKLIDETGTSLEARSYYFRDYPAKGIMRLIPKGLRSPPELIDGYAAYAIGLRYLKQEKARA